MKFGKTFLCLVNLMDGYCLSCPINNISQYLSSWLLLLYTKQDILDFLGAQHLTQFYIMLKLLTCGMLGSLEIILKITDQIDMVY
jgi:hypothetical protein